jgi:hypothetical protein
MNVCCIDFSGRSYNCTQLHAIKDYIVGSGEDDLICAEDGNNVIFSDAGVDAILAQGGI